MYRTRNLISIPTGTIKRLCPEKLKALQDKFQFLLVRLKVEPVTTGIVVSYKFQFLLVRLKVFSAPIHGPPRCISIPTGTIKS